MITLDPVQPTERTIRKRFGFLTLALLSIATAAIGTVGFTQCESPTTHKLNTLANSFFLSLRLFSLATCVVEGPVPWLLQIARFLAPALTFTVTVKTLAGIFRSEKRAFRLARSRGHIVICGAGAKASALIRDYCNKHQRVVVIDLKATQSLPDVTGRADLFAISGDAACEDTLKLARAERAERVFITTGNDSANIEIAAGLIRHCKSSKSQTGRVACHVHLVDLQTEELFKRHRIFKDAADRVDMHTFNVYDNTARLFWRERLLACGPISRDDTRRLHVVIGGLGQMGEAILLRLVRSAHYANGLKPVVTVFDLKAEACKERLLERYPALSRLCDLAVVNADLSHPRTATQIASVLAEPGQLGAVVFCLKDDYANFAVALRLAPHLKAPTSPIFIRLSRASGLNELLQAEHSEAALARQIDGFGLTCVCCTHELVLTDQLSKTAHAIHDTYRADQLAAGKPASGASGQPWATLDESFRQSNREQAEHLELKLRTYGYSAANADKCPPNTFDETQIEVLGRMEHARWCAERELAGWTYAPEPKNPERRTSPDLVPWERLTPEARNKDFACVVAIPRILATSKTI
jgi:hypothetical protein